MRKKPLLAVAVCTAALTGASASAAFAGEVIGPPGSPYVLNEAATSHANSICVFSGLNDGNAPLGMVQTPGEFMLDEGTPPGVPGHGLPGSPFPIGCRGTSNTDRGTPPFK
jgi:hypothetical protein